MLSLYLEANLILFPSVDIYVYIYITYLEDIRYHRTSLAVTSSVETEKGSSQSGQDCSKMCRDSQLALSVLLMLAVYVEAQSSAGWIRGTCGTSCENNFQCGFGKCENGSCTCSSDLSCQEGLCVWPQTYCGGSCGDEIGQPCTNGMNCVNSVCECVSGSKCLDNFSCNPSSTPVGETPATTVAPPAAGATTPLTPADVPTSPTAEDPEPLQPTVQPTTLPPTAQATAAGPFSTPGGRCNGLNSERRSIRTMSDAEWDAYTRAVQTLRNTPGENGVSVYENFVQVRQLRRLSLLRILL